MRALARIADARALETLEGQLGNFADHVPSAQLPLEPGEPDVAWVYWQMHTNGMSQQETVQAMLQAAVDGPGGLALTQMLERIGQPAIPSLVATLTNAPLWDRFLMSRMSPPGKPIVWLHGEVKTPPFTREARLEKPGCSCAACSRLSCFPCRIHGRCPASEPDAMNRTSAIKTGTGEIRLAPSRAPCGRSANHG